MPASRPLIERFNEKFIKLGPNDCWNWLAFVDRDGYGKISIGDGKECYAHIFAWMLANNQIERPTLCVLHSCDNPSCVNPAHLFLGTRGMNALDRDVKGRNWQQNKTHCAQGHEYTPENTYVYNDNRICRACRKQWSKKSYERSKHNE